MSSAPLDGYPGFHLRDAALMHGDWFDSWCFAADRGAAPS